MELTFGSLFSGIGGLDLGLERAGMRCAWQIERDEFCRAILEQHWPDVARHNDVKLVGAELEPVDLVCGGFPCQPVSRAGKRAGRDDERWLWPEYARLLRILRPRYVLVENVPGLLDRGNGFGDVLRDLADLGFDAEWSVLSACAVGAPHTRERMFLVAYPAGVDGLPWDRVAPSHLRGSSVEPRGLHGLPLDTGGEPSSAWTGTEPLMARLADGIPHQVERIGRIGNAVVPQLAELIGSRWRDEESHE